MGFVAWCLLVARILRMRGASFVPRACVTRRLQMLTRGGGSPLVRLHHKSTADVNYMPSLADSSWSMPPGRDSGNAGFGVGGGLPPMSLSGGFLQAPAAGDARHELGEQETETETESADQGAASPLLQPLLQPLPSAGRGRSTVAAPAPTAQHRLYPSCQANASQI